MPSQILVEQETSNHLFLDCNVSKYNQFKYRELVPEERGVIDEEEEHDGFGNLDVFDEEPDDAVSDEEQDDVVSDEEQDDIVLESDSEEHIGVHVNNVGVGVVYVLFSFVLLYVLL